MRMNSTTRLALLTLTIGLLSACQTPARKAPVVERSSGANPANYRPVTQPAVIEETRGEPAHADNTDGAAEEFFVIPRFGTISPWASKAPTRRTPSV